MDVPAVGRLLETERVAAFAIASSFNNPLGSMMAEADKRALLDLLQRHDIPLIEDDVYGDLY
ncbi:aminotransferase class I/II-fold pyridoxal phosphate-dependent enzyme, partial [Enterobacter hormaechei]|uniref:aminotransferase class I/II-fold pyridoxal phosphate-dependent enzyme n=1 Tax=Enterobacter hormaechei TaxID=158836 RepID=UPI0013D6BD40